MKYALESKTIITTEDITIYEEWGRGGGEAIALGLTSMLFTNHCSYNPWYGTVDISYKWCHYDTAMIRQLTRMFSNQIQLYNTIWYCLFCNSPRAITPAGTACTRVFINVRQPVNSSINNIKPRRMLNSALKIMIANADIQMKRPWFLRSQWLAPNKTDGKQWKSWINL